MGFSPRAPPTPKKRRRAGRGRQAGGARNHRRRGKTAPPAQARECRAGGPGCAAPPKRPPAQAAPDTGSVAWARPRGRGPWSAASGAQGAKRRATSGTPGVLFGPASRETGPPPPRTRRVLALGTATGSPARGRAGGGPRICSVRPRPASRRVRPARRWKTLAVA